MRKIMRLFALQSAAIHGVVILVNAMGGTTCGELMPPWVIALGSILGVLITASAIVGLIPEQKEPGA